MWYTFTGNKKPIDKKNNVLYEMQDSHGNKRYMLNTEIKYLLSIHQIHVTNLKLSSNNRLIQCENKNISKEFEDILYLTQLQTNRIFRDEIDDSNRSVEFICGNRFKDVINKARMINAVIDNPCKDIFTVRTPDKLLICTQKSMICTSGIRLFAGIRCKSLSFNNLYTHNTENLVEWFYDSEIDNLDLTMLDTSNVVHTDYTFKKAKIKNIVLENKDMSKLQEAQGMFSQCKAGNIVLQNISIGEINNANSMFEHCSCNCLTVIDVNLTRIKNSRDIFNKFSGNLIINNKLLLELRNMY